MSKVGIDIDEHKFALVGVQSFSDGAGEFAINFLRQSEAAGSKRITIINLEPISDSNSPFTNPTSHLSNDT